MLTSKIDIAHEAEKLVPYPLEPARLRLVGAWLCNGAPDWKNTLGTVLFSSGQTVANWAADKGEPRHRAIPGPAVLAIRLLAERQLARGRPSPLARAVPLSPEEERTLADCLA